MSTSEIAVDNPQTATETEKVAAAGRCSSLFTRLYTGTGAFNIIGNRRRYYVATALIILVCLASFLLRGFSWGIDFEGGTKITIPVNASVTTERSTELFSDIIGTPPATVGEIGSGSARIVEITSTELTNDQILAVKRALATEFFPDTPAGEAVAFVGDSTVSESWGGNVTERALIALVVFLVVVSIYIAVRFERDMALASLVALAFDLIVTAGIYSLVGFEVSPATVIGLLTILGFSIYDTVIVFDKVQENTRGSNRRGDIDGFTEQANLAVNQTIMRSINTTVISVLPILALVVVAVWMLGVGMLKDLALIQLVGVIVGTVSSIFLATPLVVDLKLRQARRADAKQHADR